MYNIIIQNYINKIEVNLFLFNNCTFIINRLKLIMFEHDIDTMFSQGILHKHKNGKYYIKIIDKNILKNKKIQQIRITEMGKQEIITKINIINTKFSKMPYYKNYAAVSGTVHNISKHEDAVKDILISEGISQFEPGSELKKKKKKTIIEWIKHPELSSIMPINSFISQPCGTHESPDFIVKFSNDFILAIECKSSNTTAPLYNSGGIHQNYLYVFSSSIPNETVTYMGSDIITLEQQKMIDEHIKEARERDEILNKKLQELDTNHRGVSYYTRPMIGQSGGCEYTNYFNHKNKESSGKSILSIDF